MGWWKSVWIMGDIFSHFFYSSLFLYFFSYKPYSRWNLAHTQRPTNNDDSSVPSSIYKKKSDSSRMQMGETLAKNCRPLAIITELLLLHVKRVFSSHFSRVNVTNDVTIDNESLWPSTHFALNVGECEHVSTASPAIHQSVQTKRFSLSNISIFAP